MKLSLKIFIHSIYWLVFLLFTTMMTDTPKSGVWPSIDVISPHIALNFIWAALVFYVFYFYFIRFFEARRYGVYFIFSLTVSIVITFLFLPLHELLFPEFNFFDYRFFLPPIAGTFIIAQCGTLVRGFENWFAHLQVTKELENQNLRNELQLLKSQLSPHFLFNTLNNIDSLIQKKPQDASDTLITLSDMLRYMIYETNVEKAPLTKELDYVKSYIALQKLRVRSEDYIRLQIPDDCSGIEIAPLFILPVIENAFKHSAYLNSLPVIDIVISCDKQQLLFSCSNTFKKKTNENIPGGIGLENLRRRLQLVYPGKYVLTINQEDDIFYVKLKITFTG